MLVEACTIQDGSTEMTLSRYQSLAPGKNQIFGLCDFLHFAAKQKSHTVSSGPLSANSEISFPCRVVAGILKVGVNGVSDEIEER